MLVVWAGQQGAFQAFSPTEGVVMSRGRVILKKTTGQQSKNDHFEHAVKIP